MKNLTAHGRPWLIVVLLAVIPGVFGYWRFIDRYPPLVTSYVHPLPLVAPSKSIEESKSLETKIVKPGQTYWIYQEYCQKGGVLGEVQTHLVDTIVYPMRTTKNIGQKGCFKRSFRFVIPENLPPGEYHRRVTIDYENNPVRKVRVELPPVYFQVLK